MIFKLKDDINIGDEILNYINLHDYIIPRLGVYAVKVKGPKFNKKGIANIGYRPTFNGKKLLLEVHLFNFYRNLYNKYLTVEFLKFIRKE